MESFFIEIAFTFDKENVIDIFILVKTCILGCLNKGVLREGWISNRFYHSFLFDKFKYLIVTKIVFKVLLRWIA